MSGLAAAGALAKHFEQVIVLERDRLADDPAHRPGTPQSRQLHGLLSGGLRRFARFSLASIRTLPRPARRPSASPPTSVKNCPASTLFPAAISARSSMPRRGRCSSTRSAGACGHSRNVVIRDHCRVLDLVPPRTAAASPVRAARGSTGHGRRSRPTSSSTHPRAAPSRLRRSTPWAAARPRQTTVGVDIGYATAIFEMPEPRPDWRAVLTFPNAPSDSRCCYLLPVEGDRWMACIAELHCPGPPRDLAEFLEAARRLRTQTVYDAIKNARPAGMPQRFAFAESLWRHYETVVDFPQGLIPIGDAHLPIQSGLCPGHERRGKGGEHTGRSAGAARPRCTGPGRPAAGFPGRSAAMDRRRLVDVDDAGSGLPADPRRTPGRSRARARLRRGPASGRGA